MPKRVSLQLRNEVRAAANGCCEYCKAQEKYSHDYFSIEHILPLIKMGLHLFVNLAFCCQACNNHKYIFTEAIDPLTGQMVSLFHPRQQSWDDHFQWNENLTLIIGLTPTGRATVESLHLNRENLVNLREVLVLAKKHPPGFWI